MTKRFLENLFALIVASVVLVWMTLPFTGVFAGRPWLVGAWVAVVLIATAGLKTRIEWRRR